MIVVTKEMNVGLWRHLQSVYGSTIADKADSDAMELAGRALHHMGILDAERFLAEYTTTICKVIYTPFEIGVESRNFGAIAQLQIGAHEHVHVRQWKKNAERFILEYLGDPARRAFYEAEAMSVNLEIAHYLGHERNIQSWCEKLRDYALGDEEIASVQKHLEMVDGVVRQGGITTRVGQRCITWLDRFVAANPEVVR